MRVAVGLFGGAIVVVKLASKEVEPVLEQQYTVVHEVAWAGLDQEDLLVGQVLGESRGNDTASCASSDDDKVILGILGDGGHGLESHCIVAYGCCGLGWWRDYTREYKSAGDRLFHVRGKLIYLYRTIALGDDVV